VLTPVPFFAVLAIYRGLSVCQSRESEVCVKAKVLGTANWGAVLVGLLTFVCAAVLASPRAAQQGASSAAQQGTAPASASSTPTAPAVETPAADPASAALCPVVYPDDETPASHGYHYTFFGNAFFINDKGYLLTVAHVLETFGDGGQAYILINRPNAPPQLLHVSVVDKDPQHDVAILRATPNPFVGKHEVTYVALASEPATRGQSVLALSLHPRRLQNAQSYQQQMEDNSPGTVLSFESTQLARSGPAAEVFLLSHPVVKGQSGSPVLAADSHAAVGLVEGLWLRGTALSASKSAPLPTDVPGAAVPIRYAIALLDRNEISWTPASAKSATASATPSSAAQPASKPR
jgi:hypothetical protein